MFLPSLSIKPTGYIAKNQNGAHVMSQRSSMVNSSRFDDSNWSLGDFYSALKQEWVILQKYYHDTWWYLWLDLSLIKILIFTFWVVTENLLHHSTVADYFSVTAYSVVIIFTNACNTRRRGIFLLNNWWILKLVQIQTNIMSVHFILSIILLL